MGRRAAMAEPAQKKARTERTFLFSSESVNEGHPDKLCDQVSDAVLDTCLTEDPKSKVACETATKDNMVMVAGEITTQARIEYEQKPDGSVEPKKIHTVVISTQHAEPLKAVRTKEVEGYTGPEATAPSMEEMNKLIEEKVVRRTLSEIKLKNGQAALTLYGAHTHNYINPSGKFIIGGPQGDAGLTGRKIIIDTYGGWGAHGGGAFSGKDPTKVDR